MSSYRALDHRALVRALAHALRARILSALEQRTASPLELAAELEAPPGNVSYHVRRLLDLELIRLVRETPRRGAIEHCRGRRGRGRPRSGVVTMLFESPQQPPTEQREACSKRATG